MHKKYIVSIFESLNVVQILIYVVMIFFQEKS